MPSRPWRALLIGFLASLAGGTLLATSPITYPCYTHLSEISAAASIGDPTVRNAALRDAIRTGLFDLANDPCVLNALQEQSRWLDLRPFEDVFTEYGRLDARRHFLAARAMDHAELDRMPRAERLRIYAASILDGGVTMRHGTGLLPWEAIALASDDGLDELRPLIEDYCEGGYPSPNQYALIRLDLGAGGVDREDAALLASQRLAAMTDEEFCERMNSDEKFHHEVRVIANYVCALSPLASRRNPGCASIRAIVARQLEQKRIARAAAGGAVERTAVAGRQCEPLDLSWLSALQAISR